MVVGIIALCCLVFVIGLFTWAGNRYIIESSAYNIASFGLRRSRNSDELKKARSDWKKALIAVRNMALESENKVNNKYRHLVNKMNKYIRNVKIIFGNPAKRFDIGLGVIYNTLGDRTSDDIAVYMLRKFNIRTGMLPHKSIVKFTFMRNFKPITKY